MWREWRRDNGIWCKDELERILDEYPWSKEASDFYALVMSRVWHVYHPLAMIRLHEKLSLEQVATGVAASVNERSGRYVDQRNVLAAWAQGKSALTLLDIGGNMGEMSNGWQGIEGISSCISLDASKWACVFGHKAYPAVSHVIGWAESLSFPSASFDIAVLSGILEHVLEPHLLLDEAERVTKKGGLIMVQVPYGGADALEDSPASRRSFQSHVHSIHPSWVLEGKRVYSAVYRTYRGDPYSPHAWQGETGEWFLAYER